MTDGGSARARAEQLWARAAAEREREDEARARAEALEAQAGAWAAGAEGERRVAEALGRLPTGWVALHDRLLRPGQSQVNLDSVVIGPAGVFLVDAKNWAGGVSVHDGNLWQHSTRSAPKGAELDKLARFAGEMEKTLGTPVVPVVGLAGSPGARFRPQRVRGVEIVPCGRLVKWLRAQPTNTDAIAVDHLSRKVAHTYPSASPSALEAVTPGTSTLTVPQVVGARRATARRQVGTRRSLADGRRQGHPGRRLSTLKALAGIGLLVVLSQFGPRMVPTLLGATPARTPLPWDSVTVPSVAPATVCHALTKAMIATVTGAKVVLEQARHDDACAWWLAKPRYATQAADLRVETGAAVRISLASSGITEARLEMLPGRVSVWLPENTALAGWRPGTKARQPFTASLRFTYPTGASPKQERAAEATAERTVTRLAEQIARLPDRSAP